MNGWMYVHVYCVYIKKHLFSNNSWFSKPFKKEGFCAWMDEKIRFVLKYKRNKWKTVVIWTIMLRLLHSIVCVCTVHIMKVWFQILASSDKKHSFKSFYSFSHPHLLIIIVHPAFTTQKPHGLSKIKFNVWSQLLKILKYLYMYLCRANNKWLAEMIEERASYEPYWHILR